MAGTTTTTTTEAPPATGAADVSVRGASLGRRPTFVDVVRSEWTKFRSVRSSVYALLIAVVLGVGLGALISAARATHYDHRSLLERLTWDPTSVSLSGLLIAQLAIAILGVMVVTSEYSSGLIRTSLTAVPRRGRLLAAKAVVYSAVALVVGEVLSFAAFLVGQAMISGHAPTTTLGAAHVLRAVIGAGLYLALLGLFGVAVGALLRSASAAIATVVAVTFVLPIIAHALPTSWANAVQEYWPTDAGRQISQVQRLPHTLSPWVGFGELGVFVAVVLAVAFVLLKRRDA
ncbi:MAG: ABC transporter permease [Acidimicrobiales bacterium]